MAAYFDNESEMEIYFRAQQTADTGDFSGQLGNYQTIRVRFATNRAEMPDNTRHLFGSKPGAMSFGTCYVSIPVNHKIGVLESPTLWKAELKPNPERHIVLLRTQVEPSDKFYEKVERDIAISPESNALIFIHGFNVTFADAARRTAQMAADLQFTGVSAFFSWPSMGSIPSYTVDERNIEWAEPDIKAFLRDFINKSGAKNVYIVAHSMGSRAVTRGLISLVEGQPDIKAKIRGIILAAPDIDAEVFKRDIAPRLLTSSENLTLYASSVDDALWASKKVHGYPRAGDSGADIVVINGMDTIDASAVDTSFIGHSYYGEERTLLSDMHYLIEGGIPPAKRSGLKSVGNPPNLYWLFKP
jgi:esterase/lipase superfamily enzyme